MCYYKYSHSYKGQAEMINLQTLDKFIEDNAGLVSHRPDRENHPVKPGVDRDVKAKQYLDAIHDGRVSLDFYEGECFMGSLSSPDIMYQVSYFECSCPDHRFNKAVCSHMRAFRNLNSGLDSLSDATLEKLANQARADLGF
jgi:hypothetical protein